MLFTLVTSSISSAELIISEFLARNETGLVDEDGQVADWIEIANVGSDTISLEGWTLTDNLNRLRKWKFPAEALVPGEVVAAPPAEETV